MNLVRGFRYPDVGILCLHDRHVRVCRTRLRVSIRPLDTQVTPTSPRPSTEDGPTGLGPGSRMPRARCPPVTVELLTQKSQSLGHRFTSYLVFPSGTPTKTVFQSGCNTLSRVNKWLVCNFKDVTNPSTRDFGLTPVTLCFLSRFVIPS